MIKVSLGSRLTNLFSSNPGPQFWEECRRLHLLLSRLNDKQPNAITHLLLRKASAIFDTQHSDYVVIACCYIYGAWCALAADTGQKCGAGFELDDSWQVSLERAEDHFSDRILPRLNRSAYIRVDSALVGIYNNVSQTLSAGNLVLLDIEQMLEIDIMALLEI